mgnify:CR=1 FL=1
MKIQNYALGTTVAFLTMIGLAACGGTQDLTCDEEQAYQLAQEAPYVRSPDDLDELDEFRRLPLPEASPRPPREKGSPCLDLPPSILSGDDEG